MKYIKVSSYDELSDCAAKIISEQLKIKKIVCWG